jgi:glycosyltransferase involved in cell wall biosynthesis
MSAPWLIVAGDLTPLGGMDRANHALATFLAAGSREVHVVTHRAWSDLTELPSVTVHKVWRPFNRHLLGSPLLAREADRVWRELHARSGAVHVVANGGNCRVADANWVHYLHAAYDAPTAGSAARRAKQHVSHRRDLAAERTALARARVVICNSRRTLADVVSMAGVPEARARVVYYGSDPVRFSRVSDDERAQAKRALGRRGDRPLVGFIGALGDRRKAFDSVFSAWTSLGADSAWDADLAVVGTGAELPAWKARAAVAGLSERIAFLGFRDDVPDVIAALDAVVHPARYEAYGLSVHEAVCRGVPAILSARAGVAELYPPSLAELLIEDPDEPRQLEERLRSWRSRMDGIRMDLVPLSDRLRARTWDDMAREIVEHIERAA